MNINIRKLEETDVEEILVMGLKEKSFSTESGSFWTKKQLIEWLKSEDDLLLVAEVDKKIIGFSLFACHVPTKKVTWENLYVVTEYRKNKVATLLINEGLKRLGLMGYKYIMLCANSENNEVFLKFLERFEFKKGPLVLWIDRHIK